MSFWPMESQARIDQPEPWMPRAVAAKCFWKPSKEPKSASMAAASSPVGLSPPSGDRLGQNTEWLT